MSPAQAPRSCRRSSTRTPPRSRPPTAKQRGWNGSSSRRRLSSVRTTAPACVSVSRTRRLVGPQRSDHVPDAKRHGAMDPTKVFSTARVETRCLALTGGMTVKDVADACRSAALGFAWGADRGWGRRELARWLVGPYARAVAVSHSARSGVRRSVQYRPLHEGTIHDLLVRAHAYLLDGLRVAWTWRKDA